MTTALVETLNLGVMFGLRPVLTEVHFKLERGHAAVISGPNGAGKSTLVHALCGLVAPTTGQVRMFGQDLRRLRAEDRRRVGVMLHRSMLYRNLTARENLEFYAKLNGWREPAERAAHWLKRVGLDTVADRRARDLSGGMEQRRARARAMVGEPELILFDEPFAALDRQGAAVVDGLVEELLARGGAVLLTSHEPLTVKSAEVENYQLVCGRLIPAAAQPSRRTAWRWMLT